MQGVLKDIARACGGAIIFTMPALMTEELWALGSSLPPARLALFLILSFPLLMFVSHTIYFERTWSWRNDLRAVGLAYGIGLVVSIVILAIFNTFTPTTRPSEIVGHLALQTVPAAIGALLSRHELGSVKGRLSAGGGFSGEAGLMIVGALFLSLHLAPTREISAIAYRMTEWHGLALVCLSLIILYGCSRAVGAGSFGGNREQGRRLLPNLRFTAVAYVLALSICSLLLWTFAGFDGLSAGETAQIVITLGFPASIGAGAARLIL